jgi:hypothetical protein
VDEQIELAEARVAFAAVDDERGFEEPGGGYQPRRVSGDQVDEARAFRLVHEDRDQC